MTLISSFDAFGVGSVAASLSTVFVFFDFLPRFLGSLSDFFFLPPERFFAASVEGAGVAPAMIITSWIMFSCSSADSWVDPFPFLDLDRRVLE